MTQTAEDVADAMVVATTCGRMMHVRGSGGTSDVERQRDDVELAPETTIKKGWITMSCGDKYGRAARVGGRDDDEEAVT